jgi:hypothetical protein
MRRRLPRWPRSSARARRAAVLRFVGTLERGRACAEIREHRDHPFATPRGTDNIIAFTTNRYAPTPLHRAGPGAGADVTAMGVFADIFKLLPAARGQHAFNAHEVTAEGCPTRAFRTRCESKSGRRYAGRPRNLSGPIENI